MYIMVLPYLDGHSQRGVDRQVESGLVASILELRRLALGCQVGEWVTW